MIIDNIPENDPNFNKPIDQVMPDGKALRDKGMKQAIDHAEKETPSWASYAYDFLLEYIQLNDEFMTEDLRKASIDKVPEPPDGRAWGGIVVKAKNNNIIAHAGYRPVKDPIGHAAPKSLWKKITDEKRL